MNALAALTYADWRATANEARRVLHSPSRVALWIGYTLFLGFFFVARVVGSGRHDAARTVVARADYFACALLVTLAFSLATGRGAIGIFRSRAEARFIIGSPLSTPLAIAYLQGREAIGQGLRYLVSLVYILLVFAPREVSAATALADLALIVGVITASAAIVVPRRLLSPWAGAICAAIGIPLGLLALAPAVRDAVATLPIPAAVSGPIVGRLPDWHPGRILLEPSPIWLVAVVALAAVAIGMLAVVGRDAYPELYVLSVARIERRERRRRGPAARAGARSATSPIATIPAPPGVLAFVWKSIVEFRRVVRPLSIAAAGTACCVAGFSIARFVAFDSVLFGTLVGIAVNIIVLVGIGATSSLAGELRSPFFWLSPAPVFERLCALAVVQIWRTVGACELVAAGFAAGGGSAAQALVVAVGFPVLAALLAAVGFAAFALFPRSADRRGPVAALRLLASALTLVPPLVLYTIAAGGFGAQVTALFAASLVALVESAALVGVAAWRLDGHFDRVPM